MWIAKNSLNGKTYGLNYKSIYDCQRYIDTDLKILEYLYRRVYVIENNLIDEKKYLEWFNSTYGNNKGNQVALEIMARFEYAIKYFGELTSSLEGNIIRCYNTEQERFCTGFDF